MSSNESYIPAEDEAFRTWAEHFAEGITLQPSLFMMTAAQALSVQTAVDQFVQALSVATNEGTPAILIVRQISAASHDSGGPIPTIR